MNRTLRVVLLCMLGTSRLLFPCATNAAESPEKRLAKVLADWQKRQNRVNSVEYRVSGNHKVPKGAYNSLPLAALGLRPGQDNPVNPPKDLTAPVSFKMLLDFVRGRHYREIHDQLFTLPAMFEAQVMKDAFDGSEMKCIVPKDKNPSLNVNVTQPEMTIVSGNMKNGEFRNNYYPIFFGHGRIYTNMEHIIPGQLRNKPDPDYLYIHGVGVQDKRPCLIVRTRTLKMSTTTFQEYWVDTERDSAILRYVDYSGPQPACDITIRYSKDSAGWLPAAWVWTVYSHGKTRYYEDMHVDSVKINPALTDADFELEPKPGMMVEERTDLPTKHPITTPDSELKMYRIKKNGEKEWIPDPLHRKGDQYKAPRVGQRRRVELWVLLPLMGTIAFLVWLRLWRSSNKT